MENSAVYDVFARHATDARVEVEGRWVNLTKDARVLVARSGNEKFSAKLKSLIKKNFIRLDDESKENLALIEQVMQEAMAETILLGWENLSYQGELLPYSKENAMKLLAIRSFRDDITRLSEQGSAYLLSELEKQKNV